MPSSNINQQFLHQTHSWLVQKNIPIVIGDDLDAIMSAIFMHDLMQWDVVGYYSKYSTLYLDPHFKPSDVVYLDLDICFPNSRSIGHHIINDGSLPNIHPAICNSINPNLVRGVNLSKYRDKYPLATIHFLHWLYNIQVTYSNNMMYLIWMPDSSWINGQSHRFSSNVQSWITYLNLVFLSNTFSLIDTMNFETQMQHLYNQIASMGFSSRGQIESRHLRIRGHQCQFDPGISADIVRVNQLASYLSGQMNATNLTFPTTNQMTIYKGTRSRSVPPASLSDFIGKHPKIFSYAFDYANNLNYTII